MEIKTVESTKKTSQISQGEILSNLLGTSHVCKFLDNQALHLQLNNDNNFTETL